MKDERLFSFTVRKTNTILGGRALSGWLETDIWSCQKRQFGHILFQSWTNFLSTAILMQVGKNFVRKGWWDSKKFTGYIYTSSYKTSVRSVFYASFFHSVCLYRKKLDGSWKFLWRSTRNFLILCGERRKQELILLVLRKNREKQFLIADLKKIKAERLRFCFWQSKWKIIIVFF